MNEVYVISCGSAKIDVVTGVARFDRLYKGSRHNLTQKLIKLLTAEYYYITALQGGFFLNSALTKRYNSLSKRGELLNERFAREVWELSTKRHPNLIMLKTMYFLGSRDQFDFCSLIGSMYKFDVINLYSQCPQTRWDYGDILSRFYFRKYEHRVISSYAALTGNLVCNVVLGGYAFTVVCDEKGNELQKSTRRELVDHCNLAGLNYKGADIDKKGLVSNFQRVKGLKKVNDIKVSLLNKSKCLNSKFLELV